MRWHAVYAINHLVMIEIVVLILRLAGHVDMELSEDLRVNGGQDHGAMCRAAVEHRQAGHGLPCVLIMGCTHGQSHKHLICMESRILVAKIVDLQILNGTDDLL